MTETHDYERRREIAQWYDDASGWHREINETTPKAVREAMGKLIRCARQMMLCHADEVLAACAEVERLRNMLARLCAAVEHSAPRYGVDEDWADIDTLRLRLDEAKALLAKHEETDQ